MKQPTQRPGTLVALRRELLQIGSVKRPRSLQKLERQFAAYEMHVGRGQSIRSVAAHLGVATNTILSDLRHERRLRAESDADVRAAPARSPQRPLAGDRVRQVIQSWGIGTAEDLRRRIGGSG